MEALIKLFSNPEQAQIVIQTISNYVTYVYPGIISIYWNDFLEARSTKDTQALIIKSFSISFLYNIVLNNFFIYKINQIEYNILLIFMSVLCPYIYNKIKYSGILRTICSFLKIRTCMNSVPFELLKDSNEQYTCLKIYLNDNVTSYIGYMDEYEYDEDKERFVILVGYKKYKIKNKKEELIADNEAEQFDQKVFIKFSEIKLIEKIAEDIANCNIYCKKNIIKSKPL